MTLRTHGRYPCSALPHRPAYEWPNGARVAAYVAVNVEVFPFAEGLGIPLASPLPEPDVQNFTWRDWGNRVGVWNLLDALDEHAIPATVLLNALAFDECSAIPAAFVARGDEIVGHGLTNAERQSDMDEATERAMIRAARDRIAAATGTAPRGWMSPWVSETHRTPDLLAEAGFDYVMDWAHDAQPLPLATSHGPLIAVPYSTPTNDIPALHAAKWLPAAWADALLDGLEETLRLAASAPLVFNLSLHPFLAGWPFRLRHLRRVFARLHEASDRGEIWLVTTGNIAAHARERDRDGKPPTPQYSA